MCVCVSFLTYGRHGFYGEQVGLGERVDVRHAGCPRGVAVPVVGFKVTVQKAEQEVVAGEDNPCDDKTYLETKRRE